MKFRIPAQDVAQVEDALAQTNFPKIESYPGILYVVLHGIDFQPERHSFETSDVDFFVSRTFLITVHDGKSHSIREVSEICSRNQSILAEGPVALLHRIVDNMVDHYRPEVDDGLATIASACGGPASPGEGSPPPVGEG